MKKIWWLCSWYPNREDVYEGDFVKRHAIAASLSTPVSVVYVHKSRVPVQEKDYHQVNSNLEEHIYYNPVKSGWWNKLKGLWNYYRIHEQHRKEQGLPDLVHVHITMKAGVIALIWKWRFGIPYILTEHYGIYNDALDDHFRTRNRLYRMLVRSIVKHATELTTVSNSLGQDMQQWVYPRSFRVIPNVVDTRLFRYQPVTANRPFRFLHISNMIPLKNVEGILQAILQLTAQRTGFEMHFIGNTDSLFETRAREMGLGDQVIFHGLKSYEEVAKEISHCHAMILFSDTESQSCVVLEALCSGRPAIITRVGGVKELIHERNGLVVEARDEKALSAAMANMMDHYEQFSQKEIAGEAARKYSYEAVAAQFNELYQSVSV
ncbi:MAG TPA: glycosyltransferase [Chitinophagaceae bacterium]|nr:glycosyltransferase [Chitinophagaceae bacterium]HNF71393.1 glycosyltransferase [Chitinophagaceae bacterium]